MTLRIGWSKERPFAHLGATGGGVRVFEYVKSRDGGEGRHVVVGVLSYSRADLEQMREDGRVFDVKVIGVLRLAKDVTPALVETTLGKIDVKGWVIAPAAVRRYRW